MAAVSNERLGALLAPVVALTGVDLEDVTTRKSGSRTVVLITIDRDGGVDLDIVAVVSRKCADALEEDGAFGEAPYVLEVSSPGCTVELRKRRMSLPRFSPRPESRVSSSLASHARSSKLSSAAGRVSSNGY